MTPQSQQTREEKMDQEIARLISECSDQNKKLGGSEILMGSGRELHLKLEKLFAQAIQSAREEERKKWDKVAGALYYSEFEVIEGVNQHPKGLSFNQWLEALSQEGE